jgi:hypothetical protein
MMSEEDWAEFYCALLICQKVRDKWFEAVGHHAEEGRDDFELADKYRKYFFEEIEEFMLAWDDGVSARLAGNKEKEKKALVEQLDGLGDVSWTLEGVGRKRGVNMAKIHLAVAMSNFSKLDEHGKAIKNEAGKVMKGPNFFVPPIQEIVEETLGV